MLKDKNLFIDETEQVNFKKLFQAEWEDTLKNGQATLYLSWNILDARLLKGNVNCPTFRRFLWLPRG